ncbi:hypothetical protein HFN_0891 [Helicobacter fennelliae MRY12-0050]|uniref:Uncharacterized protein n=1 Tax=Helicobacter fennelliae MRY12-0050 TaxID=1325130 RepID=T1D399_9HELI|nr:hypothetical protein HFN_0891 [Helicobacter fennelliae MRY12-0050]
MFLPFKFKIQNRNSNKIYVNLNFISRLNKNLYKNLLESADLK